MRDFDEELQQRRNWLCAQYSFTAAVIVQSIDDFLNGRRSEIPKGVYLDALRFLDTTVSEHPDQPSYLALVTEKLCQHGEYSSVGEIIEKARKMKTALQELAEGRGDRNSASYQVMKQLFDDIKLAGESYDYACAISGKELEPVID